MSQENITVDAATDPIRPFDEVPSQAAPSPAAPRGAEIDQAMLLKVRHVLYDAGECLSYDVADDVRRLLRQRDEGWSRTLELQAQVLRLRHGRAAPGTVALIGLAAALLGFLAGLHGLPL